MRSRAWPGSVGQFAEDRQDSLAIGFIPGDRQDSLAVEAGWWTGDCWGLRSFSGGIMWDVLSDLGPMGSVWIPRWAAAGLGLSRKKGFYFEPKAARVFMGF
jgi:hypothetical protein